MMTWKQRLMERDIDDEIRNWREPGKSQKSLLKAMGIAGAISIVVGFILSKNGFGQSITVSLFGLAIRFLVLVIAAAQDYRPPEPNPGGIYGGP